MISNQLVPHTHQILDIFHFHWIKVSTYALIPPRACGEPQVLLRRSAFLRHPTPPPRCSRPTLYLTITNLSGCPELHRVVLSCSAPPLHHGTTNFSGFSGFCAVFRTFSRFFTPLPPSAKNKLSIAVHVGEFRALTPAYTDFSVKNTLKSPFFHPYNFFSWWWWMLGIYY